MMTVVVESDYVMYLSALNMRSVFLVLRAYHFLTDNSLQSADNDQQESRAVVEKPHDAVVKFDTYQNLQRHRAVLPATVRLSCHYFPFARINDTFRTDFCELWL